MVPHATRAARRRSLFCLTPGWLSAPFGSAAVCFMQVVGISSLQEWDADVTGQV
jgi:hypothetical protein